MAKKSHLYRRGNQYWYRASVTVAPGQRVDVRISLRTDSLFVSRWFCSILDVELIKLTDQEQHVLSLFSRRQVAGSKPGIPMSELKTLVKNHFTTVLDDAHRKRQSSGSADWSPATKFEAISKSDYIDLLLATRTTRASADIQQAEDWVKRQIAAGHMTVERAAVALETLKVRASSGDIYPFSKAQRDWIPFQAGRQLSPEDEAQLDILMLAGEREIWNEIAGDWRHITLHGGNGAAPRPPLQNDQFSRAQSPPNASQIGQTDQINKQPGLSSLTPGTGNSRSNEFRSAEPAGAAVPGSNSAYPQTSNQGSGAASANVTFEDALEAFIEAEKTTSKSGKFKSEPQVRAMAKILFHVVGGAKQQASILRQLHLGYFVAALRQLPTQWGKSAAEQQGGIQVSLQLGETLPPGERGVSAATEGRHLSMLSKFINFSAGRGYIDGTGLAVMPLRQERSKQRAQQKKNRGRVNWTSEEILQLLATPPFLGCKGPKRFQRYRCGTEFYWDSAYWMPLLVTLQGFRSAEAGGFLVGQVRLDQPIPVFVVEPTDQRGTKTESSTRQVPIHPELLRLGFGDFVKAVAAAGHRNLFPDLVPTAKSDDFAKKYYKSFVLLRNFAFPEGTDSLLKSGGRVKDKDVHSARGFVITKLLNARHSPKIVSQLVGHDTASDKTIAQVMEAEKINPTTLRYCDEPTLETMLEALETLTPFTQALKPLRAKLNTIIYGARK